MGGMHSALRLAQLKADVVCAFDINQHANLVYEKNYNVNVKQTSLERITPKQLDAYNAQMWLMAPPCQPYTRQGKQLDQDDPRAAAILNLVKIWPELRNKPQYVLIENVVNFESSQTRDLLVEMFRQVGYTFQEFHLSPTQFGIPNSRMRYYCLAKLRPANFYMQEANGNLMKFIPKSSFFQEENHYPTSEPACLTQFLDKTLSASDLESLMIPEQKVLQAGQTLDIVFADSNRSCCFTKAYGNYANGTGSAIQTASREVQGVEGNPSSLLNLKLRYFSPNEICRLHGFSDSLDWCGLSLRQRYALLGNSLNVVVVAELLKYLTLE